MSSFLLLYDTTGYRWYQDPPAVHTFDQQKNTRPADIDVKRFSARLCSRLLLQVYEPPDALHIMKLNCSTAPLRDAVRRVPQSIGRHSPPLYVHFIKIITESQIKIRCRLCLSFHILHLCDRAIQECRSKWSPFPNIIVHILTDHGMIIFT